MERFSEYLINEGFVRQVGIKWAAFDIKDKNKEIPDGDGPDAQPIRFDTEEEAIRHWIQRRNKEQKAYLYRMRGYIANKAV